MMHDARSFQESWPAAMNRMKSVAPEIGRAFAPFFGALMKDGALPVKQKELIALGIAVATHCEPCIHAHAEKCLRSGSSAAEILEAAGVAVMMGGGPAYTAVPTLVAALDALGATAPAAAAG